MVSLFKKAMVVTVLCFGFSAEAQIQLPPPWDPLTEVFNQLMQIEKNCLPIEQSNSDMDLVAFRDVWAQISVSAFSLMVSKNPVRVVEQAIKAWNLLDSAVNGKTFSFESPQKQQAYQSNDDGTRTFKRGYHYFRDPDKCPPLADNILKAYALVENAKELLSRSKSLESRAMTPPLVPLFPLLPPPPPDNCISLKPLPAYVPAPAASTGTMQVFQGKRYSTASVPPKFVPVHSAEPSMSLAEIFDQMKSALLQTDPAIAAPAAVFILGATWILENAPAVLNGIPILVPKNWRDENNREPVQAYISTDRQHLLICERS